MANIDSSNMVDGKKGKKVRFSVRKPKAIICDIEGTTTSFKFWSEILAPYLKESIERTLHDWWARPEVMDCVEGMRRRCRDDINTGESTPPIAEENASPKEIIESVVKASNFMMDMKKHSDELKALQLLVWFHGCYNDLIKSHVYKDVPSAFSTWSEAGIRIFIFATGVVHSQKLVLATSLFGNIAQYVEEHFDSDNLGRKTDPESFKKIVRLARVHPKEMIFFSDSIVELKAATSAGVPSFLVIRSHNKDLAGTEVGFKTVKGFDEIEFVI